MARDSLVIKRKQTWGIIRYDMHKHSFTYLENKSQIGSEPYAANPVVLNIVITRRCNMDCDYCVAKDFTGIEKEDLLLTRDMIKWIKNSPFMLLVLTGGEPLMPPYNIVTTRLVDSINNQGVIVDTNGTILPDSITLSLLKKKRVMLRVSVDSMNPLDEINIRRVSKGQGMDSRSAYDMKFANIRRFLSSGINTSVQTVVWRKSKESLYQIIDWLSESGIKRWYLQRLIPSNRFKNPPPRFALDPEDYYPLAKEIANEAGLKGIECVAKMDLRHNSVFLLTADGALYTQGEAPGQKVRLGSIREEINFFDYVSAADHACRYYLPDSTFYESKLVGKCTHAQKTKSK